MSLQRLLPAESPSDLAESGRFETVGSLLTRLISARGECKHVSSNSWRGVARRNANVKLLVFIPPGTRTAAEDSFSASTFEDLPLYASMRRLRPAQISKK